jgi:hypothetical protein
VVWSTWYHWPSVFKYTNSSLDTVASKYDSSKIWPPKELKPYKLSLVNESIRCAWYKFASYVPVVPSHEIAGVPLAVVNALFPKSILELPALKSYNFLEKFTSSTSIAGNGPVNPFPSPCTLNEPLKMVGPSFIKVAEPVISNEPVTVKLPVTVAAPVIVTPDCQLSTSEIGRASCRERVS